MAAPAYISRGTGSVAAMTTLAVTAPAGAVDADLHIACIAYTGSHTVTPPSLWNILSTTTNPATGITVKIYFRFDQAVAGSYTWTFSGSTSGGGVIAAYSGTPLVEPVDEWAGTGTDSSTTCTAPSVQARQTNERLVCFFVAAASSTTFTTASGMTERSEDTLSTCTIALDDQALTSTGSTGSRASTLGIAQNNVGSSITIKSGNPDLSNAWPPLESYQLPREHFRRRAIARYPSYSDPTTAISMASVEVPPETWRQPLSLPPPVHARIARLGETLDGRIRPDTEDVTATLGWEGMQPAPSPRKVPALRPASGLVLDPLPLLSSPIPPVITPPDSGKPPSQSAWDKIRRRVFVEATVSGFAQLLDAGDVHGWDWLGLALPLPTRRRMAGKAPYPSDVPPPLSTFVPLLSWVHAWATPPRLPKRPPNVPSLPGRLLDLSDAAALFTVTPTAVERPRTLPRPQALYVTALARDSFPPPENQALWGLTQEPDRPQPLLRRPAPPAPLVFWPLDETAVVSWAVEPQIPRQPIRRLGPATSHTLDGTVGPPALPWVQIVTPRWVRPSRLTPSTDQPQGDVWTTPFVQVQPWVTQQLYTPRARPRPVGAVNAPTTILPDPGTVWFVNAVQPRRLHPGHARSETWDAPPLYASGATFVVLGPYVVAAGDLYCAGAVAADLFSE